jgi:hypothetical protein
MGIFNSLRKSRPDFTNSALCAYVATFPGSDRLMAHLTQVGAARHFNQLKATFDDALDAGFRYVTADPLRVDWNSAEFRREMEAHLLSRYSWLRSTGLGSIRSYCMYLCWKDGYDFSRRS